MEIDQIISNFDVQEMQRKPNQFTLHNNGPKYDQVQLIGSFDEWKTKHAMKFDDVSKRWFFTMHLKPGNEYHYKYIVNGQYWVVNDEEPQKKDRDGNVNNFCGVFD